MISTTPTAAYTRHVHRLPLVRLRCHAPAHRMERSTCDRVIIDAFGWFAFERLEERYPAEPDGLVRAQCQCGAWNVFRAIPEEDACR